MKKLFSGLALAVFALTFAGCAGTATQNPLIPQTEQAGQARSAMCSAQATVCITNPGCSASACAGGGAGAGDGVGTSAQNPGGCALARRAKAMSTQASCRGGGSDVAVVPNTTAGLNFQESHFWPRLQAQIGSSLQQVEDAIWADLAARLTANPTLYVSNPSQVFDVKLPNDPTGPLTLEYRTYHVNDPIVGPYINIGTVFVKSRP